MASLALLVVVTAPTWPVAVLGFTLLGAGVSVIAPLSFSAAARIAGGEQARVDAVIARFNQFNYVGGLLGAVLTGLVGAGSLRLGFAVPMVLILAMLPLARAFAPAGARRARSVHARHQPVIGLVSSSTTTPVATAIGPEDQEVAGLVGGVVVAGQLAGHRRAERDREEVERHHLGVVPRRRQLGRQRQPDR